MERRALQGVLRASPHTYCHIKHHSVSDETTAVGHVSKQDWGLLQVRLCGQHERSSGL